MLGGQFCINSKVLNLRSFVAVIILDTYAVRFAPSLTNAKLLSPQGLNLSLDNGF